MSNSWNEADDNLLRSLVVQHNKQWNIIATYFPTKTPSQVASRWEKYLDPNLIKGAFTEEEDNLIRKFVAEHGPRCWQRVTEYVPMRSAKQCRERWYNHLDPSVINKDWTPEEDQTIFEKHQQIGPKWAIISRVLPGRTDNAIKNRWNASISKRVMTDADGNEYLAPDTSKRKRRVARQLPFRPPPIRTQTPEVALPEKKQSPPAAVVAPQQAKPATQIEINENLSEQPLDAIFDPQMMEVSPGKNPMFMISPPKISPGFLFSPLSSGAAISPNSPFKAFVKTPNDDFAIDYFDTNDILGTPKY